MYIAVLLIYVLTLYGGYSSGVFEASYLLIRNMAAFLIAWTLFHPLTGLLAVAVPHAGSYPWREYMEVCLFFVLFIAVLSLCDRIKYRYLFSQITVSINRYADRIGGTLLGISNGVVLSGIVLILWAMLPFVKFIPRDFGRVHTGRLPLDSGSLLLKAYSHSSDRMGGRTFPLEGDAEEMDDDQAAAGAGRSRRGWLWYYRSHSDITLYDIERISAIGSNQRETRE